MMKTPPVCIKILLPPTRPPHSPGKNIRKAEAEQTSPHHVTFGGEVAAELFEEDGDGNGYSDEAGKYI
jgi:hypothetical protein